MRENGLDFGVLGSLQIRVHGALMPLGTPKQRAVLATLLINRNRTVSLESLITAAWEDWPPSEPRASLHAYVSNLRRLLGSAGVDPRTVLASAPPGYRLSVPNGACDLDRFNLEKTAGVRAAAAGQFDQASDHLSAALAHWRGPVLEDLRDFRFAEAFATALLEDKLIAHTVRVEAEIASGRAHLVISELEALIVDQPYREPLWAQLMTAYYLVGRQSDALEAYRRLKTTLSENLGIDPGVAVRSLHERILRQELLDVEQHAKTGAQTIITALQPCAPVPPPSNRARLRDTSGRCYPVASVTTGIGRLADNDIVLDDPRVSRYHAVIIDTGVTFVINDLRSANGVKVQHKRIRGSTTLTNGDVLRIGRHRLTFEISRHTPDGDPA